MKKISIVLGAALVLGSSSMVYAAKNESAGSGLTQAGQGMQASAAPAGTGAKLNASPSGVQVQNQVQTQNKGEESHLKVSTQEQTNLEGSPSGMGGSADNSARSAMAAQKMSVVAEKVEELISSTGLKGGIGDQVRVIAQEQKQAQTQIKVQLSKVESRQGLMKSLIGPDYKALKTMRQQLEQNHVKIQQLQQLKLELTNEADKTMLQETIQALIDQNTNLSETSSMEVKSGSMLGWLFRLFA